VSEASFYLWKKKHGKLGMTKIRELRQLRDENARLQRLNVPWFQSASSMNPLMRSPRLRTEALFYDLAKGLHTASADQRPILRPEPAVQRQKPRAAGMGPAAFGQPDNSRESVHADYYSMFIFVRNAR
jgi:hypothetical protein